MVFVAGGIHLIQTFEYQGSKFRKESRLFTDKIRNDPWVLFHGASSCSENEIETCGLKTSHFPVSLQELRDIIRIFKSMNWRSGYFAQLIAWGGCSEAFRPICMACVPELAAHYCGRDNAGGEVAGTVRGCIRNLRKYWRSKETRSESLRFQLEEYEIEKKKSKRTRVVKVSRSWLRAEILRMAPIETRLHKLRAPKHYGIVYALRFEKSDLASIRGSSDVYISFKDIAPARIIAKARIFGSQCNQLEPSDERHFRDYRDPNTLIGAVVARDRTSNVPARSIDEREHPIGDYEWEQAIADPAAGVDLAEQFDRKGLLKHLRRLHPEIFSETKLCEEYGW